MCNFYKKLVNYYGTLCRYYILNLAYFKIKTIYLKKVWNNCFNFFLIENWKKYILKQYELLLNNKTNVAKNNFKKIIKNVIHFKGIKIKFLCNIFFN